MYNAVKIVNTYLCDIFCNLVVNSKKRIRLCAPYIKESIINKIYDIKKPDTKIDIISNFSLPNFYNGSSDIEAFKRPIESNDKVYNCQTLHAKIYIFDDKYAIITSSNLTPSGFRGNLEYGIFIKDNFLVKQSVNDFKAICNGKNTVEIDIKTIIKIQAMLNNLPKYKKPGIYLENNESTEVDSILNIDIELLKDNLNNWQRETLDVIDLINNSEFTLSDIYVYEDTFAKAFPNNNTIRESIRRNLQELRNLGLIKFYGNGIYKKLWKRKI